MDQDSTSQESELTPEELNLLGTLQKTGAALPAELAVKTFSLPEEIHETLGKLKAKKLIDVHQVPGLYGELVSLSKSGMNVNTDRRS